MDQAPGNLAQLAAPSKRLARRLLTIGENRLQLLMLEVQEERERLLRAILFALGTAVFGFLAGGALTVAIVVSLWGSHPVAVLLALTGIYVLAAGYLYRCFLVLLRNWQTFPATLDQLRKDRQCLEKRLD